MKEDLKTLAEKIEKFRANTQTEEATKAFFIAPFLKLLGYDVTSPEDVVPEYMADFGDSCNKVDYALLDKAGQVAVLVECKHLSEKLLNHIAQLKKYYAACPSVKFAVLTNGCDYMFFSDTEQSHVMDNTPFLSFSISAITDADIACLQKFDKSKFNVAELASIAEKAKYDGQIKALIARQLSKPDDDFTRYIISTLGAGQKTTANIDRFRPIIKKALNDFINEEIQRRVTPKPTLEDIIEQDLHTDEEATLDKVKELLSGLIPESDIKCKRNKTYLGILYQGKTNKWLCRLYFWNDGNPAKAPKIGLYHKGATNDNEIVPYTTMGDFSEQLLSRAKMLLQK
ncbi:type I restriction enzyme HsdR N-terminal domain-containing protein [Phascolarctobacterium succinatutens]|jgi:hypothetical protein|uniref:Type I restriction enzyme R protein N-terminal domain-containing protein n=1 Tax=Phascolarctobacterium succinatutens TaxID=626940 RepID=A0A1Q6RAG1_9FIRM|nr:type I restriction enzyme HsdR N-terminal domain-containing protein [Phascolarctobacterium succinatutens]OLA39367.1 MAG: hypothetical protein BHW43_00265 [Phascolarctobacterium succinatutens]